MGGQLLQRLPVPEGDALQNARRPHFPAMQQRDNQIRRLQRRHGYIPLANGGLHPGPGVVRNQGAEDPARLLASQRPEHRLAQRVRSLPADVSAQAERKRCGLELGAAEPLGQRSEYGVTGHGEPLRQREGAVFFAVRAGQAIFAELP
ncbi:hypothetical protein D3C80_1603800 [compost metagenome]